MKIVFWGKGDRGASCLKALVSQFEVLSIVTEPNLEDRNKDIIKIAQNHNIDIISPENPNTPKTAKLLKSFDADIFVLAGYGKIIKQNIFDLPRELSINLHGGKLPQYRGSSPMNWAIINDEKEYSVSIIKVDKGVDTGDILIEKNISISSEDNISSLHNKANEAFSEILIELLTNLESMVKNRNKQSSDQASYYSIRKPEDGFILWESLTAKDIHNRIRALTIPYPCAFSFYNRKKVILIKSKLMKSDFIGEPGRVYKVSKDNGLLVAAKDKCLWIKEAIYDETGKSIMDTIKRYDRFCRIQDLFTELYSTQ